MTFTVDDEESGGIVAVDVTFKSDNVGTVTLGGVGNTRTVVAVRERVRGGRHHHRDGDGQLGNDGLVDVPPSDDGSAAERRSSTWSPATRR